MDIGIIGGADGPTVVFISGVSPFSIAAIVIALIAVIGVIIWSIRKRKRKQ